MKKKEAVVGERKEKLSLGLYVLAMTLLFRKLSWCSWRLSADLELVYFGHQPDQF